MIAVTALTPIYLHLHGIRTLCNVHANIVFVVVLCQEWLESLNCTERRQMHCIAAHSAMSPCYCPSLFTLSTPSLHVCIFYEHCLNKCMSCWEYVTHAMIVVPPSHQRYPSSCCRSFSNQIVFPLQRDCAFFLPEKLIAESAYLAEKEKFV